MRVLNLTKTKLKNKNFESLDIVNIGKKRRAYISKLLKYDSIEELAEWDLKLSNLISVLSEVSNNFENKYDAIITDVPNFMSAEIVLEIQSAFKYKVDIMFLTDVTGKPELLTIT
jgi:hypothetical protein